MDITKQFGIEPILLLAQIVNFLIILFVLKKFFYKPIIKMLDDRRQRIAESLKNADTIEQKLQQTEEKSAQILKTAQEQGEKFIAGAQSQANKIIEAAQLEAKANTQRAVKEAIDQIELEKAQMKKELEAETLGLVVAVTQKVLGRQLKQKEKQDLTKSAVSEISRQS